MRKSLYTFLALALIIATPAYAAATKADRSRFGSSAQPNLTDSSNGNTVDITAAGDLSVRPRGKSVQFFDGGTAGATSTGNSTQEIGFASTGATVWSITFTGDGAGDTLTIYDGTTDVGNEPKFEIEIGTAKTTVCLNIGGVTFSTEVYLKFYNHGGATKDTVSIVYDTDTIS